MNYDMHHWVPPMYNTMQQFAEIHPDDPKMYRTFFLQRDNVANKIHMRAVSNWVHGEVPSTISGRTSNALSKDQERSIVLNKGDNDETVFTLPQ